MFLSAYKNRSIQKELLDGAGIPFEDIARNMKELEWINAHLGGHQITIEGFKQLAGKHNSVTVCELGSGGGDNLNALYKYCMNNNIQASFIGIDINKDCIEYAKKNTTIPGVDFILSDYSKVVFKNKPDIIFSSLFCHHFKEDELVQMLLWMKDNSTKGFFVNDLHRHPLAFYFIKIATRIFSRSYLVRNDAPLSVLRGFKKSEWEDVLSKAGIIDYGIKWKWAFRYLVTVKKYANMQM